jgi:hypothetical protein
MAGKTSIGLAKKLFDSMVFPEKYYRQSMSSQNHDYTFPGKCFSISMLILSLSLADLSLTANAGNKWQMPFIPRRYFVTIFSRERSHIFTEHNPNTWSTDEGYI